jgi:hypothetical protein
MDCGLFNGPDGPEPEMQESSSARLVGWISKVRGRLQALTHHHLREESHAQGIILVISKMIKVHLLKKYIDI